MSRLRAALFAVACTGAALGVSSGPAQATPASPPSTTPTAATPTPGTDPAGTPATTAVTTPATTLPAGSRGGADAGSVVKPRDEPWSFERLAVTTALVVIALAAAGYVYGKVRSMPPKHPDLVTTSDELEIPG